jgi:hypothetical protein
MTPTKIPYQIRLYTHLRTNSTTKKIQTFVNELMMTIFTWKPLHTKKKEKKIKKKFTYFWNNPIIIDAKKTCIFKFKYNQYIGNARKQLFFGPELYPTIPCLICNSPEPNTWKHVLLSCINNISMHYRSNAIKKLCGKYKN